MERLRLSENPNRPLIHEILGTFTHFVKGQALIGLALIAFHLVGFYMIDLEYWWAAGAFAGAAAVIPFLGMLIGAIPAVIIAVTTGTVETLIWALVVLTLGQMFEALYLTPKILGQKLSLNPAVVFVAAIVGGFLAGPIGAFLAAPVAAAGFVIWRRMKKASPGA